MTEVRLGDVAEIHAGGRLGLSGTDFIPDGVPAYGAGGQNGMVSTAEYDREGIVLSSIGARCGKCFHVKGKWTSLANTQVILPDQSRVDNRYLWYQLNDEARWPRSGSAQPFIKPSDVKAHRVWLPALDEQRRLAAILIKADTLRNKRRQSLAHLDELRFATFIDMFGDRSSIMVKWPTKKLGELLDFLTSGSRGWAKHYADSGDLFLRIQNVRRDRLDLDDIAFVQAPDTAEARRTRVQSGDVLLSITADLGRTAVVPDGLGPAFINQHLSLLRASSMAPEYLSAFLASEAGQLQVLGRNRQGVKAGLNFDDIRSIEIPLPPKVQQDHFVMAVRAIEQRRCSLDSSASRIESLCRSVRARAFSDGL